MKSPLTFVVDGTLDGLLPAALTTAVVTWLGLVLLLLGGGLAVAVDLHRQGAGTPPAASGVRLRRVGLVLALAFAAAAAAATLIRFSALT